MIFDVKTSHLVRKRRHDEKLAVHFGLPVRARSLSRSCSPSQLSLSALSLASTSFVFVTVSHHWTLLVAPLFLLCFQPPASPRLPKHLRSLIHLVCQPSCSLPLPLVSGGHFSFLLLSFFPFFSCFWRGAFFWRDFGGVFLFFSFLSLPCMLSSPRHLGPSCPGSMTN